MASKTDVFLDTRSLQLHHRSKIHLSLVKTKVNTPSQLQRCEPWDRHKPAIQWRQIYDYKAPNCQLYTGLERCLIALASLAPRRVFPHKGEVAILSSPTFNQNTNCAETEYTCPFTYKIDYSSYLPETPQTPKHFRSSIPWTTWFLDDIRHSCRFRTFDSQYI